MRMGFGTAGIALAILLAALGAYVVYAYNALVRARQMTAEAWSGIDVQLKRRADLVPNLVRTVEEYAAHERGVLDEVTAPRTRAEAKSRGDVAGRAEAESLLGWAGW